MIHNANYCTSPPAEEMSQLRPGVLMRHCLFMHLLVIFIILFSSVVFGFLPAAGFRGCRNSQNDFPGVSPRGRLIAVELFGVNSSESFIYGSPTCTVTLLRI
ncbi:hypothetical protein BDV38DRAFT_244882 [Aspergillus pseudotamarii]|uniref:Uncharacterized protein n=1 Tax=Aspergillus pseudotamarii TaxID=132259 RepID=A0A5N6SWG4_ASPPS|nr:uncharacterized protein BDV38DRAFT_244882 [Aspergillus pseudotamarii]KAE8138227.1 hypothetical protein BDV38DRAFT_244882 [Aspergillus pseudotamarii]